MGDQQPYSDASETNRIEDERQMNVHNCRQQVEPLPAFAGGPFLIDKATPGHTIRPQGWPLTYKA